MKLWTRLAAALAVAALMTLAPARAPVASMGNSLENSILLLLFNATAIADVAENDSSSPLTTIYVSLHSSDPGETGNQTTNECAYTSYARVGVTRNGSNWIVTNNSVSPAATISFPAATGSTCLATHFGVGTASSGSGVLWFKGTVSPNISISSGVTPQLTTSTAITLD